MKPTLMFPAATLIFLLLAPGQAHCAAPHLPGAELGALWGIPFACMLLSIALLPLCAPRFWEHNPGKIAAFWGFAFLLPSGLAHGAEIALFEFWHVMIADYLPFIIMIGTLFIVAGGVRLTGRLVGTPLVNTGLILAGTLSASWMGTTGASMLMIRPLLRANAHRKYKAHSVIFFIFLVANIGGSLTPLGDPPLFLGFLRDVPFFWTFYRLIGMTALLTVILSGLYLVLDRALYAREGKPPAPVSDSGKGRLGLEGKINLVLLAGVVGMVFLSGTAWSGGRGVEIYHVFISAESITCSLGLLGLAGLSWKLTSRASRALNGFNWAPIIEVSKLFFGIFVSMIPVIAILKAGEHGALGSLIRLVSDESGQPIDRMYFWLTGLLSSFLDNAPTYLVFFNLAGGDAVQLTGVRASTLAAISAGAVFMGANTYIGNAPNFMVRSIAENQGVKMPSFFGYMLWSGCILIPCFVLITLLFF